MKLSETAENVIRLATAIRDYWDAELPKRHPKYPLVSPGEDSGPAPPEETELRTLLNGLPDDEIYKLILLMYLGRGDFGTAGLQAHFEDLKTRFRDRDRAVSQMEGKASLADYLADGMAELQKKGIDIDQQLSH